MNNIFKKTAIAFLLAIFLLPNSFVFAENGDGMEEETTSGMPLVILSRRVEPTEIESGDRARVTLEMFASDEPIKRSNPVDLFHVLDMSGSMSWFGEIIEQSVGYLTEDWEVIRTFELGEGVSSFDLLLETISGGNRYLRLKSPSDQWYGYMERNGSCIDYSHLQFENKDYLQVKPECFEAGTWQAWGKGVPEKAMLTIGRAPTRADAAKDAAKDFTSLMQNQDQVGVISFDSNATVHQRLTSLEMPNGREITNSKIDSLRPGGSTAIGKGIEKAIKYLGVSYGGRSGVKKTVILLSDGKETKDSDPLSQAEIASAAGIQIYTIGLGGADENLLTEIASTTLAKYFRAALPEDLSAIYGEIAVDLVSSVVNSGRVVETLPSNITYLGNPSEEPVSVSENEDGTTEIIWKGIGLGVGEKRSISFDISIEGEEGGYSVSVYPDSRFEFTDYYDAEQSVSFPEASVRIVAALSGGVGGGPVFSSFEDPEEPIVTKDTTPPIAGEVKGESIEEPEKPPTRVIAVAGFGFKEFTIFFIFLSPFALLPLSLKREEPADL